MAFSCQLFKNVYTTFLIAVNISYLCKNNDTVITNCTIFNVIYLHLLFYFSSLAGRVYCQHKELRTMLSAFALGGKDPDKTKIKEKVRLYNPEALPFFEELLKVSFLISFEYSYHLMYKSTLLVIYAA